MNPDNTVNGLHSVMGANKRLLRDHFCMWKCKVRNASDQEYLCIHIKELCEWEGGGNRCDFSFLSRDECPTIIDFVPCKLYYNCAYF